jgi:glycosyltransferase involved in cell wall biosynthesis
MKPMESVAPTSPSPDTTGVSVIVITRDEEHVIADCLESVRWADEIVVLDCGSTDRTVQICRTFTDRVYETDWPGFGIQKNRALSHATRDWVLSLDADEQVTPDLAEEIRNQLPDTGANGLVIPFRSSYLGRFMRHGDWRNESHLRLFRRTTGRFSDDAVHERLIVEGEIGALVNPILHHSFASVEEVQDKVNRYSTAGAERRFASGKRSSLLKALSRACWTFFRGYVLKAGFLDGREGFLLAVSNAEGSYYTHLKLLYLHENASR